MSDLCQLTGREARAKIASGEATSADVTRAVLDRIAALEPTLHAYVTVCADAAMKRAAEIDRRIGAGEDPGPLAGVPIAVKDNMCTRGLRTTCSSKILNSFEPPYDATVVELIEAAGAVIVGKTNLDEFAMGSSTENSAFGATRNPWDTDRVPGGSSGGSAAAVAADEAILGLGSDTGGSIRQPASLCGVVGLKPTYGRVSRYGLVAFGSSLDQIGPITKDVTDAALLMNVIAQHDPRDSTSADVPGRDYLAALDDGVEGMTLGVPAEYFGEGIDPEVEKAVRDAIAQYESLGARTVEVSLPHTEYAVAVYYIVATAEASSNLARYDGVHYGHRTADRTGMIQMYSRTRREGFGDEVKRRIMLGTYALSSGYYDAYYRKAAQVRTLIQRDFDRAFEQCDALICPTAPTAAFKVGEKTDDPLQMYLSDIYTISCNLAGYAGISIPCGLTGGGLPIGLQLLAGPFEEEKLLRIARTFEAATNHHQQRPELAGKS